MQLAKTHTIDCCCCRIFNSIYVQGSQRSHYHNLWLMYTQVVDFCVIRGPPTVSLMPILHDKVFFKFQNPRKAGTLCTLIVCIWRFLETKAGSTYNLNGQLYVHHVFAIFLLMICIIKSIPTISYTHTSLVYNIYTKIGLDDGLCYLSGNSQTAPMFFF